MLGDLRARSRGNDCRTRADVHRPYAIPSCANDVQDVTLRCHAHAHAQHRLGKPSHLLRSLALQGSGVEFQGPE